MPRLSKKVCKKCWVEYVRGKKFLTLVWDSFADDEWKEGTVFCPVPGCHSGGGEIGTNKIPDYCPYKLEHTVLSKRPK